MKKPIKVDVADQSLSKNRLRLWLRILGLSRDIENQLKKNFRTEFQTTLPRFDVMAALDRNPEGMKMSELSSALKVSNGNITGIIDRLIDSGLVKRFSVQGDRRAYHITLTPLGKNTFLDMAIAHEYWINEILKKFTADEISAFSERLKNIRLRLKGTSINS